MANGIRSSAGDILRLAFISRLLILTLIVLFRFLFDPYDTSGALNHPCHHLDGTPPPRSPLLWPRVAAAIEQSVVWDSVYFVRIAECGYEYEQTFAFLPLLPVATSLLSRSGELRPLLGLGLGLGFQFLSVRFGSGSSKVSKNENFDLLFILF